MKQDWTTPVDIRAQMEKRWNRGDLLRMTLQDEPGYPLRLRLKAPTPRQLENDFAAVSDWLATLRRHSRAVTGCGYSVHWQQRQHRLYGSNDWPTALTIDSEADALALLGKRKEKDRFIALVQETLTRFPSLRDWIFNKPLRLLQQADDWKLVLSVLEAFHDRPRPGCYLRELDIPGVHSKFIEQHRGLLADLLDWILPPETIDTSATGGRGFNWRYGLRDKPIRTRFRLLDPALSIQGLTDLEIPVDDFADISPSVDRVFITENEINGLAFPAFPAALVIFGLGYGVDILGKVPWLANKQLHYWGDIDTHGFAILSRLRKYFPQVSSLLMDIETLEAHRPLWGREDSGKRFIGELSGLTAAEQQLYHQLCDNQLAQCLRLEQEHIRQSWLADCLERLKPSAQG